MNYPIEFKTLIGSYSGKRFLVSGGMREGLKDAIQKHRKKNDVWIAANHHGGMHGNPDFVVAMDGYLQHAGKTARELVREYTDAPIISCDPSADIRLRQYPGAPLRSVYSGVIAIWVADRLGASTIDIVGMNGYDGSVIAPYEQLSRSIKAKLKVIDGGPLEAAINKGA